jgi:hypothetical protein
MSTRPTTTRSSHPAAPRPHARAGVRAPSTLLVATVSAMLLVVGAPAPSGAQDAAGSSDAGVTPRLITGANPGGNVTCAEAVPSADLSSSDRLEWEGERLTGDRPAGLEVSVGTDTVVSWTSTFPISAVIVKGGSAANVYVYSPTRTSDGGLVAPHNRGGRPAELSNLTFCWDVEPGDDPDLVALCEQAAGDLGPIVSFAGPMAIVAGVVDPSTVPVGHVLTFDATTDLVTFGAPFPVAVAVTFASDPVTHRFDPPTQTGSVPLSSNPGNGEIMLCGLGTTVVSLSCAQVGSDLELAPMQMTTATLDQTTLPPPVTRLVLSADGLEFESDVPVAGVMVTASEPVLHEFEPAVFAGTVPLALEADGEASVVFCLRRVAVPAEGGGGGEDPTVLVQEVADPTEIASGGGPSTRTSLALLGLVLLALAGWTQLLPRLRD